jgi:hypothetical protein
MLRFNTWSRLPQNNVTKLMRQRALRAHYIYNVKRNGTTKARVVVNGKRQHEATFSDTTSPVASQFQLRLLLLISAFNTLLLRPTSREAPGEVFIYFGKLRK